MQAGSEIHSVRGIFSTTDPSALDIALEVIEGGKRDCEAAATSFNKI
jgi:hypothetical protein